MFKNANRMDDFADACSAVFNFVLGKVVEEVVQIVLCRLLESAFGLRHAEIVNVLRVLQSNPRIELEQKSQHFQENTSSGAALQPIMS